MALDATTIISGINNAGFTADEWTNAMKVLKLQVQLGLKRAEISNLQAWLGEQSDSYNAKLDTMQQAATAIEAAIQELAPSS